MNILYFMMEDQWDVACRLFESEEHLETHYSRLIVIMHSKLIDIICFAGQL